MRQWFTNSMETEAEKVAENERLAKASMVSDVERDLLEVLY